MTKLVSFFIEVGQKAHKKLNFGGMVGYLDIKKDLMKEVGVNYLLDKLVMSRTKNQQRKVVYLLLDEYNFEEDSVEFSDEFIDSYGYLMNFLNDSVDNLKDQDLNKKIDYIISGIQQNLSKEQMIYHLYKKELIDLYDLYRSQRITQSVYEQRMTDFFGSNNFNISKMNRLLFDEYNNRN